MRAMSLASPLYDRIGATYDATRQADPDLSSHLLSLLDRPAGSRILDIGCGTGNYTLAMAEAGLAIVGLDRSQLLLGQARQKAHAFRESAELPGGMPLIGGDAAALPFEAKSFDGAICTLAIHHFADLEASFAEARRVLDGGRLVIFTSFPEQMTHYWLAGYFPRMIDASADQMPDWQTIESALRRAGFRTFRQVPYWMAKQPRDHFLYCGKHLPALYLDARIRANISSFAALAEAEELATGIDQLRRDIETGEWDKLRRRYGDEAGDYAFVVCQS
jgi:ubiquinone/menaquinone biosynthesis C-methylase UbiE